MPFAAGVFSLVAGNPVVTGTIVSSTWANNTLSDIGTGLSTAVLKDGTQTTTAPVPFVQGISLSGGPTLNKYTTANWTPVIRIGGTVSGITYGNQPLTSALSIGNWTIAPFTLTLSSKGSATGNVQLGALPYANANASPFSVNPIAWGATTTLFTNVFASVDALTTTASILAVAGSATALAQVTSGDLSNTTTLQGIIEYFA